MESATKNFSFPADMMTSMGLSCFDSYSLMAWRQPPQGDAGSIILSFEFVATIAMATTLLDGKLADALNSATRSAQSPVGYTAFS